MVLAYHVWQPIHGTGPIRAVTNPGRVGSHRRLATPAAPIAGNRLLPAARWREDRGSSGFERSTPNHH